MKKVVIILPTYNEKENLEKFISDVFKQEKISSDWKYEILVVDSHSPDGTLDVAKKLAQKNPRIHTLSVGKGLGVALIEGHKFALRKFNPDALAQMDADAQVEAEVLPRLLLSLDEGYDLAIGSRFVKGGQNKLSFIRRLFTNGSSIFCRLIMGPVNVGEFTNSARAFTPALFKKINLDRLPWREKTFIVQPAFLNEAILAGAKYKEVPLIFKNREEGYSKMKVLNYTYDVITYCIDARLHKWGIDFPFFRLTRKAKTIIKFSIVGFSGTFVDFIFYNIFISYFSTPPATSKGISTMIAILNNFTLNSLWTFRHRKTNSNLGQKLGMYYFISLVGLLIAVGIVKILHTLFDDGTLAFLGIKIPYYNIYFFVTIPPVMIWNFIVNHFFTWRHERD